MKPRKIEPSWIFWFGFVISPLICAVNGTISTFLVEGTFVSLHDLIPAAFVFCIFGFVFTAPLTLATLYLNNCWDNGHSSKTRWLSLGSGLLTFIFWFWLAKGLQDPQETLHPQETLPVIGVCLLPFLWSVVFLLFAVFARPPKT